MEKINEANLINKGISDYEAGRVVEGKAVLKRLRENKLKLYELLAQSEDDVKNGRTAPIDGMFNRVRSKVRSMNLNNRQDIY